MTGTIPKDVAKPDAFKRIGSKGSNKSASSLRSQGRNGHDSPVDFLESGMSNAALHPTDCDPMSTQGQEPVLSLIKKLTDTTTESQQHVITALKAQQADTLNAMQAMKRSLMKMVVVIAIVLMLCNFGFSAAAASLNKDEVIVQSKVVQPVLMATTTAATTDSHGEDEENHKAGEDHHHKTQFNLCGTITKTLRLVSTDAYLLTCPTIFESGAKLIISPGVVVRASTTFMAATTPKIVIKQGAKIFANGTAEKPITFTSAAPAAQLPGHGLWGGIVICGKAPVAQTDTKAGYPYGGTDPEDSSGVLRYVQIWYAGGTEVNALTLAGVGRGTKLEYVETMNSGDDGFEFFGGTVNGKHLASYYAVDDAFDFDNGYQGEIQFMFAMVADTGDSAFEISGRKDANGEYDAQPRTHPHIRSVTILGNYPYNMGPLILLKDGAGGTYDNIITWNAPVGIKHTRCASEKGFQGLRGPMPFLYPNYLYWSSNNLMYVADGSANVLKADTSCAYKLNATGFDYSHPGLTSVPEKLEPLPDGSLGLIPVADSISLTNHSKDYVTDFFVDTRFRGAFSESQDWMRKWSWLDINRKLVPKSEAGTQNLCGVLKSDLVLTPNISYVLTCQLFVRKGVTLTIRPGVTIKALQDTSGKAPAVVIMQGAKIMAEGTASRPITFTSAVTTGLPQSGLWGGLVICGYAPIANTNGTSTVEGLGEVTYGGQNPFDNSGILRYVRVWYGGRVISADNEINGITLAGVGNGTTIEHVEVAHSKDDGIEFFGGTVNAKWLSIVYPGDDGLDTDAGYQGKLQFVFILMGKSGDNAMEMDSKTNGNLKSKPRSHPQVRSITIIGQPQSENRAAHLREATGGAFSDMLIANMPTGIRQSKCDTEERTQGEPTKSYPDYLYVSSWSSYFVHTDLSPQNPSGLWGEASINSQLYQLSDDCVGLKTMQLKDDSNSTYFRAVPEHTDPLNASSFDPSLSDAAADAMLEEVGLGTETLDDKVLKSSFFTEVDYRGAFSADSNQLWIRGWSWLDENDKLMPSSAWRGGPAGKVAVAIVLLAQMLK